MGRCRGYRLDDEPCQRSSAGVSNYYCHDHVNQRRTRTTQRRPPARRTSYHRDIYDSCWEPASYWEPLVTPHLVSPQLPVPVTPQNPVPAPPPAPEPVIPTPGYPAPTNTGAPDVDVRNGVRFFSYNVLYHATNRFSADRVLGSGGYGKVHAGVLLSSLLGITGTERTTEVAIKMLGPTSMQGEDEFQAEVSALTGLRHANIVPLYGICQERSGLVYPRLSSSVLDKLKTGDSRSTLPGKARVKIAIDVAAGLAYLHSKGFVHRDIKPGNVLLDDDGLAHLTDFGLARRMNNDETNTNPVGTSGFMDPEYLQTEVVTKASDIYSFGVVLACLLKGTKNPYQALPNALRVVNNSTEIGPDALDQYAGWLPVDAQKVASIVSRCCHDQSEERPSARDTINQLCEVLGANGSGIGNSTDDATAGENSSSAGAARLCKICWEAPIDTVFRPCNHSVVCMPCAQVLVQNGRPVCPIGRCEIGTVERGIFDTTYVR